MKNKLFDYKKYGPNAEWDGNSYKNGKICAHIVIGFLLLILLCGSFRIVRAGQRGVVLHFGAVTNRICDEGLCWKIPVVQKIAKMDVMIAKEEKEATAASKDLQIVTTQVAINYHLDPNKVNTIYQKLRRRYSERVIMPTIEEYIKKSTAQFTAEELITKREEVKEVLRIAITESLANNYIIVNDIFITNFEFSPEFDQAIEQKVTAEQLALKAKNDLERIKTEAQQKIERAKADAEAIRIQAQAITQQGGKDYVNLKAVEKWDGTLPVQMIPGGAVPFINLTR